MKLSLVVAIVPFFAGAGIKYWDKQTHSGNSYTYTEGSSPATVRLRWLGKPDGIVLIIR